jgi:hypothetical protein
MSDCSVLLIPNFNEEDKLKMDVKYLLMFIVRVLCTSRGVKYLHDCIELHPFPHTIIKELNTQPY